MSHNPQLEGTITLAEIVELTGLEPLSARCLADKYAGGASCRLRGGVLHWPLRPLVAPLVARRVAGLRPGGWCTRSLVDQLLTDWSAKSRQKMLISPLLRRSTGLSSAGHRCTLYALSDVLAISRRNPDFYK